MITNNLNKRIENIDNYISLASRLSEIVDEPKVLEDISCSIKSLEESRSFYISKIENEKIKNNEEAQSDQRLANYAYEYHDGDFKKAREELRKRTKVDFKNYFSCLAGVLFSGFLSVIKKRELSKAYHEKSRAYLRKAKAIKNAMGSRKRNERRQKEYFEVLKKIELSEAEFFNNLKSKLGFEEKEALYLTTEQPEIVDFLYLEILKQEYGKGIV